MKLIWLDGLGSPSYGAERPWWQIRRNRQSLPILLNQPDPFVRYSSQASVLRGFRRCQKTVRVKNRDHSPDESKSAMNSTPQPMTRQLAITRRAIGLFTVILVSLLTLCSPALGQVRTKKPDRGVYQPNGPTIYPNSAEKRLPPRADSTADSAAADNEIDDRGQTPAIVKPIRIEPLPSMLPKHARVKLQSQKAARLLEVGDPKSVQLQPIGFRSLDESPRREEVNPVSFEGSYEIQEPVERSTSRTWSPQHSGRHVPLGQETYIHGAEPVGMHGETWVQGDIHYDTGYGDDYASGHESCGEYGCDSMGSGHCGISNGSLSFDPCRWFGSFELLLLWRNGDRIPPLVTTSPDATPIADAGVLPDATVLAGDEKLFDQLTAGGRLTIGTWIDSCHQRSVVARLWAATEEDFSFGARELGVGRGILAIPTTTTVDGSTAAVISFPDSAENEGRFGTVSASASSNVYGGDISVRQFWTGGLGTTYDILYGYQYMRLDEDLSLRTNNTLTQDQAAPPFLEIGDTLVTSDSFDTLNEFHGGQFGLAGRYREGCWSFDFLAKVGFGNLQRRVERRGSSTIIAPPTDPNNNNTGILVTDGNRGTFTDNTFGWVPELDVSIGWHKYPRFDVTFGYNLIAMTDAVRLSDVMDPNNNVDTPQAGFSEDTFYLQGLHFGIRHVY